MNSISINEKKYVKAADIARELGYTTDYVGQLCRAEKVDAQLVGRSWYLTEDSIRAHKQTRYRSAKTYNKKVIKNSLAAKDLDSQETFEVPISVMKTGTTTHYAEQEFYTRAPKPTQTSYFFDDTGLIPQSNNIKNKTGKISISLGDARVVKIKSKSGEFDFNPTELPIIKFTGSLAVKDVYDSEKTLEKTDKKLFAEKKEYVSFKNIDRSTDGKSEVISDEKTSKIRVKHLRKDRKLYDKNLPLEHNASGVVGMRRERIVDRNPVGGTLKISVPTQNTSISRNGAYFVLTSIALSSMILVMIFGVQSHIRVDGTDVLTSYTFEIDRLLATVYSAW